MYPARKSILVRTLFARVGPVPLPRAVANTSVCRGRPLSDARIPTRQKPDLETLKQFFASAAAPYLKETGIDARPALENGAPPTPTTQDHDAPSSTHTEEHLVATNGRKPQDVSDNASTQHGSPVQGPAPTSARPAGEDSQSKTPLLTPQTTADLAALNDQKLASTPQDVKASLALAVEVSATERAVNGTKSAAPSAPAVTFASQNGDAMDVDGADAKRANSPSNAASDAAKPGDIPSSPDSIAQTATTPAVHDVSVNTSPENENDSYADSDDKTDRRNSRGKMEDQGLVGGARDDTVETQLLQESAAAGESQADASRNANKTQPQAQTTIPAAAAEAPSHAMDVDEPTQDAAKKDAASRPAPKPATTDATNATLTERTVESSTSALNRVNGQAGYPNGVASPSVLATLPTPKPSTGDASENLTVGDLVLAGSRKDGKRKAPTVLFGKQKKNKPDTTIVPSNLAKSENLFAEDYFTPLFVQTFAQNSKWLKNLDQLVHHARKTISSSDSQASIFDNQSCKILKRVYHLQQQDKWSLRQPKRGPEPVRQKSHWDVMLQEMKWMRTDFREERKWKHSAARSLAFACAEWVQATPEQRKSLQVIASIPPRRGAEHDDFPMIDNAMIDAAHDDEANDGTAGLDSDEVDLVDDGDFSEAVVHFATTVSPSAIFALQDDAVVFELNPSVASDRLLAELPMYGSPLEVPKGDLASKDQDPDAAWRRPVVPVSKYIETPIVMKKKSQLQKKSRYAIEDEGDNDDIEEFVDEASAAGPPDRRASRNTTAADNVVGLFDPSLKIMRERLHAGHQFRPPSEYPMPMPGFYEYRPPSQWTVADDDQLKKLVREYSYNWSLTASLLASKSLFVSGAERRTPWECFERWISLEGFPSDASRSPYFKIYQSRIDGAQKAIREANEKAVAAAAAATAAAAAAAQTNGNSSSAPPPPPTPVQRRRPTLAVRVERHRNQKHLATFEAMRKLAKKREAIQHKQQQQAAIVATRKSNEPPQQRPPTKTPREYSRMRAERDQRLAERMAEFAQRQSELHRKVGFISPSHPALYFLFR